LVSRYTGSTLIGYHHREFDEFVIPLGPIEGKAGGGFQPTKQQRVEGQATRLMYVSPAGRSPLEVLRNYEDALTRAGFAPLYRCAGNQCGALFGNVATFLYPPSRQLQYGNGGPLDYAQGVYTAIEDPRYIALRRTGPDGDAYVSLFVAVNRFSLAAREVAGRTIALLDVVVHAKMETGKVTVNAAAMAREINATGRVALYGISFDTGMAIIKPESEATLGEIAKLMKEDPKLNLYVVGHTDNVGAFEQNLALSDRRAAAVVESLTKRFGVAASRLRAMGVGPVAPVAPNVTDDGRAKNRRVELVRQ
jgi:outer membrane protein OmpA-like peptidoglycan-associated protein